jgi:UDPglucose--hexose-1-phosphate uridylyltransferase
MSELRWNPLLGEWVVSAPRREGRTFAPPPESCPFCPDGERGGEVPTRDFDVVVFENRFPAFEPEPSEPEAAPSALYPVRRDRGVCEMVLYTPEHGATLSRMPVDKIYKLVRVWADRFEHLGQLDFVKYVFPFENQGESAGAGVDHPHAQIYGYPFVPPRVARELEQARGHHDRTGRCLLCDIIAEELKDGRRVVVENDAFVAFVPFFARWPYEVHVYSTRHVQALSDLTSEEQRELASILKAVLVAFDGVFGDASSYTMAVHQRPVDGLHYDFYHLHVEFYPPMRSSDRPKLLAGSENGAGVFINDALAEEKAAELRDHLMPVVWNREHVTR